MSSPVPALETVVSFSEQDLALFSEASGDRNPLHVDAEYARRTPYGQQVVFGCLSTVACLNHISLPASWAPTWIEAEFLRPIFLGVSYRVETSTKDGVWLARLFDGSLPATVLALKAAPYSGEPAGGTLGNAAYERHGAVVREQQEIVQGLEISGRYAGDPAALSRLSERWKGVDPFLLTALCWSSYLVGMELPGQSALFSKLALNVDRAARCPAQFEYWSSVASVDSRFGFACMDVSLLLDSRFVAWGQCWSFIRPAPPALNDMVPVGLRRDSLAGRVAVLIGAASRGLGAATKRSLELRGATVYSLARSAGQEGTSLTEVGDPQDTEALARLRDRVLREQGRLDFLVCTACPPILPLRIEANTAEQIGAYIKSAVSITFTPLCSFLDLLNSSDGCAVIVSSAAVEEPVPEWPHYIAAKQAIETLTRVASLQYPRIRTLIARPSERLTPQGDTPIEDLGASSPLKFSDRLAARLAEPLDAGIIEILK